MSDGDFTELMESLNQTLEYEHGERDDLRVTVLSVPSAKKARPVKSTALLKQKLLREIASLTEADLERVADYVDLLKYREQAQMK